MKTLALPLLAAVLVATGCGDEDEPPSVPAPQRLDTAMETEADEGPAKPKRKGTTVTLGGSEFGEMLFDSNRQAIYIFENDHKGKTVCHNVDLNGGFWWVIGPDGRRRA